MATYTANIRWALAEGEDLPKGRYSRGHTLSFDGGTIVPASASPHVVGKWAAMEEIAPGKQAITKVVYIPGSNGSARLRKRRRWITCIMKLTRSALRTR